MNARQIELVQTSFEKVVPIAATAADLFYGRLFEIDPTLRPMFPLDLSEQKHKLMHMLTVVVRGLNRLDQLVPAVQQLGARHTTYGVKSEHYATVASALLWTLEAGLGPDFTPEVKEAWVAAYTVLATTMQAAAEARKPKTAPLTTHPMPSLAAMGMD